MQYLSPDGAGPSSNTCPKWASQFWQRTSVRIMPWLESLISRMAEFSKGIEKLGQPQPASNLVLDENNCTPQQTHWKIPSYPWSTYLPVKGLSVPDLCVSSNSIGESSAWYWATVFFDVGFSDIILYNNFGKSSELIQKTVKVYYRGIFSIPVTS